MKKREGYLFSMLYNKNSFFKNRHGADELGVTLVILASVLYIAYPFFTNIIVSYALLILAILSFAFALFRSFSRNVGKRRAENIAFINFFKDESKEEKERRRKRREEEKAREREKKEKRREEEKTYAFFLCPKCKKELRVPKGKGKIKIKCPNCGEQFIRKS